MVVRLAIYVPMAIVLVAAGLFLVPGLWSNSPSGAAAALAQSFFALVLVVVTSEYVILTRGISRAAEKTAERTADLVRPILVPENITKSDDLYVMALGEARSFPIVDVAQLTRGRNYLLVKNIGAGPALNISAKVEPVPHLGYEAFSIVEEKAGLSTLAKDALGLVLQWQRGSALMVKDPSWITIGYDDILGRHFQTKVYWNNRDWEQISIRLVKTSAPVRNYDSGTGL